MTSLRRRKKRALGRETGLCLVWGGAFSKRLFFEVFFGGGPFSERLFSVFLMKLNDFFLKK